MNKFLTFLTLFTLLTISVYAHGDDHACIHDQKQGEPGFQEVDEDFRVREEGERLLGSANYSPLRIYPHYDTLASSPSDYVTYVKTQLVPPILDYFRGALKAKYPIIGKLKLNPNVKNVCDTPTPSILTTTGVDGDFFIFFDSDIDTVGSWAAVSYYCYLAKDTKRPIVARATLNRAILRDPLGDPVQHEKNIYLLMHEIIHSLGFSQNVFKYFIDNNGNYLTNHTFSKNIYGSTDTLILNVPFLTDRIRKFFGCSSLEGVYMENFGSSGTAGSHFERRLFLFETMSSGTIHGRRMSEFSLGVLEATGWYYVDYSYAEPYWFGQGQGCNFVRGSCADSSFQFDEFCTGQTRGCAAHGRGGGPCSGDPKLEGCRYVFPDIDYDCDNADGINFARLPELQTYGRGQNAKCFTGNLTNSTQYRTVMQASFCFKYECAFEDNYQVVNVKVGKDTLTCRHEGAMQVEGYRGQIDCPDPVQFCNTVGRLYCPRNCMGRGKCVNNKCVCNKGFTGIDCAMSI